jgi:hypothetical protein
MTHPLIQSIPFHSAATFIQNTKRIRNPDFHLSLQNNLIAHLWVRKGKDIDLEDTED